MNTEDHIQAFLASGGKITRCPTVYGVAIPGAEPIRSGVSERTDPMGAPLRERQKIGRDIAMKKAREAKAKRGPSSRELEALAESRRRQAERTRVEDAKLLAMLERGESLTFIAETRGCSVKRVKIILKRAGHTEKFLSDQPQGEPPMRHRKTDQIVAAHGEGLTSHEIAAKADANIKTVRMTLKRLKLKPHKAPRKQPKVYSDEVMRQMADLYGSGAGTIEIKAKFDCSQHTVMRALDKFNVPRRPTGVYAPRSDKRQGGNVRSRHKEDM